MRKALVRRVRHWIVNRGWLGFFAEVLRQIKSTLKRRLRKPATGTPAAVKHREIHPFDEQYGVETGGLAWGEELGSGGTAHYWSTGYYGIAPSAFWQALDRLDLNWPEYTFLDVGCGKGRALMLALKYPFGRIVGWELSPELTQVAADNLRRFTAEWRRDVPVEALAGDATGMELPAGPLVLYMYHPFAAPVMVRFLAGLRESLKREPREVYLLYVNPELDKLLAKTPFLEKLWRECFFMGEEDAAADRFGLRQEYVSAYRARLGRVA